MKRIKTFDQLFEAAKMHEDCEEFFRITKGTEEIKQIETWYKLHPTRTGRINVLINREGGESVNNPGSPHFYKTHDGQWRFTFVASGSYYGEKRSTNLIDLLRIFIGDIIFKFAPADFNRKEAREMTDDTAFILSKIWKTPLEAYSEYRSGKGSDIITDLSFVESKSNLLGTLKRVARMNVKGDDKLSSLYINLSNIVDLIPDELKEALELGRYDIEVAGSEIDIIPKGIGTKTISNSKISRRGSGESRKVKVSIGYKTEDEVVKAVEEIVKKYAKSIIVYVKDKTTGINTGRSNMIESELLTSIVRSILGEDISDDVDTVAIIDNYFKKNPLELYILNNNPKMKAGVIKRTGIKDYSRLGMGLKNGLL